MALPNFASVIETSGFPFVTAVFPRLSVLSLSMHLNQANTTEGATFILTIANWSADNTYVASLSCCYIRGICSPLAKATN
jgi:hypothetical protein